MKSIFVKIFFALCFLLFWSKMYSSLSHNGSESGIVLIKLALIALMAVLIGWRPEGRKVVNPVPVIIAWMWILLCPIVALSTMSLDISDKELVASMADFCMWPLFLIVFFVLGQEFNFNFFARFFFGLWVMSGVMCLLILITYNQQFGGIIAGVIFSYYPLCLLPVMLEWKKSSRWAVFFFVVTAALLLLSLKRTGIITLGVVCVIYVLLRSGKVQRSFVMKIVRFVWLAALLVVIGYFSYDYIDNVSGSYLSARMEGIGIDTSSQDRIDIYHYVIDEMISAPGLKLLAGHGHNSVFLISPYQRSAHNDFLEVVFDYGVVYTALYLAFVAFLIARLFAYYKTLSPHLLPYACSLAIFLMLSLTSHLILYPTYFLFLCAYWGLIFAQDCGSPPQELSAAAGLKAAASGTPEA